MRLINNFVYPPFAFLSALDHGIFTSILCGNLPESAEKYKDSKFYYKNNTAESLLCGSVSINFPHGGSLDIPMEGCLNSKAFTRRKVWYLIYISSGSKVTFIDSSSALIKGLVNKETGPLFVD